LRQQYEVAKVQQEFETLAIIVNSALGGKGDSSSSPSPPSEGAVETWDELSAAFSGMFGGARD